MAVNNIPVSVSDINGILSKFPEQYREKLRVYTGEEIFYIYKLALFKPRLGKDGLLMSSGDGFFLGMKAKLFRWIKEPVKPVMYDEDGKAYRVNPYANGIHPSAWLKLGAKYRSQFHGFVEECITQAMMDNMGNEIKTMTQHINARRVG